MAVMNTSQENVARQSRRLPGNMLYSLYLLRMMRGNNSLNTRC